MGGAERVVLALRPLGEAGQAATLAERTDAVAASGQDLVRIGLMADIPDQPVGRGIEDIVKRHRQLDDAQPGAQMTAGHRNRVDRLGTQLIRQLPELVGFQLPDLRRNFDSGRATEFYW